MEELADQAVDTAEAGARLQAGAKAAGEASNGSTGPSAGVRG